jgi:general secretion pathway protein A
MYLQYFGLKEPPFSIAPNPRYLFMSERHREALAHLVYGLQGAGGFVVLTGEVGAGKTTLARRFLEEIPANCRVAYLINPNVTVTELLQTICDEFDIKVKKASRRSDEEPSNKAWVDAINAFLLTEYAAGRNCVVLVDEAQNLTPEVMEQLRLLTNLETDERKLLQIILVGQPELRDLLARHDLRQVDQRVVARYHLDSLDVKDTEHYLAHRLGIAGGQPDLFAPTAATAVHAWTHGVPRRINVLADRALLGAYAKGESQVNEALVNIAAGEVFQTRPEDATKHASVWYGANSGARTSGIGRLLPWVGGGAAALALAYAAVSSGVINLKTEQQVGAPAKPQASAPTTVVSSNTPKSSALSTEVKPDNSKSTNASISNTLAPIITPTAAPAASLVSLKALAIAASNNGAASQAPAIELLQKWGITPPASGLNEPLANSICAAAQKVQLTCYTGKAGLDALKANNHLALLTLQIDGTEVPALLEKLDATSASLMVGNTHSQVPLAELAQAWQGDFVSLWKPLTSDPQKPPVSNLKPGASGPAVAELLDRLKRAQSLPADSPLLAQATSKPEAARYDKNVQLAVRTFQIGQGLLPDGNAGPQTLLRLNALALAEQPRLAELKPR